MNREYNPVAISLAFRFYSRALTFPYDELTHEFQYLLRELEKNITGDIDNTIAAKILDVINFYQGEEMKDLQAEYTRLFAPPDESAPLIPLQLGELHPEADIAELTDLMYDSALILDAEEFPDSFLNLMDLLASLFTEDILQAEHFFNEYIQNKLPEFCRQLAQHTTIGFYKNAANGLAELIQLIE